MVELIPSQHFPSVPIRFQKTYWRISWNVQSQVIQKYISPFLKGHAFDILAIHVHRKRLRQFRNTWKKTKSIPDHFSKIITVNNLGCIFLDSFLCSFKLIDKKRIYFYFWKMISPLIRVHVCICQIYVEFLNPFHGLHSIPLHGCAKCF